jgi:hypothetical protein
VVSPCLLLISHLSWVGWNAQRPGLLFQNCWLPTERDQTSGEKRVLQGSFDAFATPSYRFLVVSIRPSPTRTGELTSHHLLNLMRVEGMHMTGCYLVSHAITVSAPYSLWHDTSHLGFGGLVPCPPS